MQGRAGAWADPVSGGSATRQASTTNGHRGANEHAPCTLAGAGRCPRNRHQGVAHSIGFAVRRPSSPSV